MQKDLKELKSTSPKDSRWDVTGSIFGLAISGSYVLRSRASVDTIQLQTAHHDPT